MFTLIGFGIGLAVHRFEENSEEIFKKLIQKHKNADWYPEGLLLAERAARLQSLKAGEEGVVAVDIEGMFCCTLCLLVLKISRCSCSTDKSHQRFIYPLIKAAFLLSVNPISISIQPHCSLVNLWVEVMLFLSHAFYILNHA